jgi:hypothetical protein
MDHMNPVTLAVGPAGGVPARILDHPDAGSAGTATVPAAAPTVVPIAPAPDWVAWTVIAALAFAAVAVAISALLLLSSAVVRALAASLTSTRDASRTSPLAVPGVDLDAELDRDLYADLDLVENGR